MNNEPNPVPAKGEGAELPALKGGRKYGRRASKEVAECRPSLEALLKRVYEREDQLVGRLTANTTYSTIVDTQSKRILGLEVALAMQTTYTMEGVGETARLVTERDRLRDALQWALPLARIAQESHRLQRVQHGHMDIQGTYKDGVTWVGIWQKEVDEIESAEAALAPPADRLTAEEGR